MGRLLIAAARQWQYAPSMSRMNRRYFVGSAALGAISLSGSLFPPGLRATPPSGQKSFKKLFDGKSLQGWHPNPDRIGHGTGGQWRVIDGAIVGEQDPPGSGNGGLLLTDRKFGDFELSVDMNCDWGPCSGVFFRCTEKGEGFQMYVDYHDRGNVGHLRGEMPGSFAMMPFKIFGETDKAGKLLKLRTEPDARKAKWPAGVYKNICEPEEWLKVWKLNDWNTARIRCTGKHPRVKVWINDLLVADWNGETSTLPGYDKKRVFGLLGRKGSIGLQVHGGKGWPKGAQCRWKNIRVKEL
ncbi:MAG: hypothetical protein ACI8QF_001427 [Limisphaerales bacterium]